MKRARGLKVCWGTFGSSILWLYCVEIGGGPDRALDIIDSMELKEQGVETQLTDTLMLKTSV